MSNPVDLVIKYVKHSRKINDCSLNQTIFYQTEKFLQDKTNIKR